MAIEVISKIKQKNNGTFKIVDSQDVAYENPTMDSVAEMNIKDMKQAIDYIFDTINTTPTLSYVDQDGFREGDKKYWAIGEQMRLVFNFSSSASGKVEITILRNGFSYRQFTTNKGLIVVDLGAATGMANYTYTISAIDSMGRDSETTLTFNHILGGVEISSTFEYVAQNTVYLYGTTNDIVVPCSVSYAENGYRRYINYSITSEDGTVVEDKYDCGLTDWSSNFTIPAVTFTKAGSYRLNLQGEVTVDGNVLKSDVLSYPFAVIPVNTIAVAVLTDNTDGVTTQNNITISYRVITDITSLTLPNALAVRCLLYKVDGDRETQIKTLRNVNVTSGDTISWAIGRLSSDGKYRYEIIGEPAGGATDNINYQSATHTFDVKYEASIGSDYEHQNLIAYFDANDMDNSDPDPSVWKAKNSNPNGYYYFKLHDLNYRNNGWIVDSTDGSKMLKFTGDSYAELRYHDDEKDIPYSPISEMTPAATGNSLEVVFKTRNVGQPDACVLSCRNEQIENYGGYSVYYDGATISSNEKAAKTSLVEEKETHVTFVIDKNIRRLGVELDNTNIENMNPVQTMNIYVNGVRTKVVGVNNNEGFANTTAFPSMQLLLNAYQDVLNGQITGFGTCEIKLIRLYNGALNAAQVFANYVNSKYDPVVQNKLIQKNDPNKADIPIIRFVRNKIIDGKNVKYSKYSVDKSFEVLNSITLKSSSDKTIATSKNSWVNCTMWYTYIDEDGLWKTTSYNDVDVYLQGTSSLQYPIKNYKIKIYGSSAFPNEDGSFTRGKKKKIIPPNKSDKDGWHLADSTYTLKCDYMEQSHKNNTPTATMYEEILDNIVASTSGGYYTPAKNPEYEDCYVTYNDDDGNEITTRKYRDAVTGFPVLLYYNENKDVDEYGAPIDYNVLSTDEDGYYANNSDTMVGTLMFNIDKTGKSLGFEIPTEEYTVESPSTGEAATYSDGTEFKLSVKPCVSLEGTSNSAKPSAASWYTMEEANQYTYAEDYLRPQYNLLLETGLSVDFDTFNAQVQAGRYPNLYTYAQYCELDDTGIFKNVYDYISASFEPRWVFTEEVLEDGKELDDDTYNDLTYGHIIQTIEWISEASKSESKFRKEFSQHFNLAYCIAAYLQMQMFIQVDNAGKNVMYDEWGDGIIHPRPYDLDTQMGENNSGDDVIHASAEINVELSPTGITGPYASQASASNQKTDKNHTRYIDYNTPNSKLWISFGKYFRQEIVAAYTKLRNDKIYDTKYMVSAINAMTSDIIGESFYNKDAGAKYMSQTYYETSGSGVVSINDAMLPKLQGNRDSRFEQMFAQRILFLDTFFGYTSGDTDNTSLVLRSDAVSAGNSNVQIGISVYSPGYVTIAVGTDATIVAYIDTAETYEYANSTYEGVLFNLPIVANNKDIVILGAGNIKSINHMENLVLTNFICNSAKKLTSIVITNSTALASLSLGANTYLRTLNLHGSKTLSGNLNLANCENLQYIDITDTSVTSVTMPTGGNLKSFVAENCALTSIIFNDLQFLEEINIRGCTNIVSYEMISCPRIYEIDTSGYINLNKIVVSSCENVTSLNLASTNLSEMAITSCDRINSINLSSCNGSIMRELNLSTVYGLKTLNLSSSQPSSGILLILPLYKREYATLSQSEIEALTHRGIDVYWHELTTFNANSSTLRNITYGVQTGMLSGLCDFSQLTNLTSLNIQSCQNITRIENINFTGTLTSLFYNCQKLTTITGTLTSTSTSASNLFYQCYTLSNINDLTLNLDMVTTANNMMRRIRTITYDMAKKVLDRLPNVRSLSGFMAMDSGTMVNNMVLQSNMFERNTQVTDMTFCLGYLNITTVPSGLFNPMAGTLTNMSEMFMQCTKLVSVPNNLFKYLGRVTNIAELFRGCTSLTTAFPSGSYYDLFPENSAITTAYLAFYNCTALQAPVATDNQTNGLQNMFKHLPNLTDMRAMFYGTKFITGIPELIFAENKKLQYMDAAFANCSSITSIPSALFSDGDPNVLTHPSLTSARGLFSNCTALTGVINQRFLGGANNLTNIGHANALQLGSGPVTIYTGGMFANTAIMGYNYNFLHHLKKLTSVSMLFYKGSCTTSSMIPSTSGNNNNALIYVYIGNESYPNRIYNGIFNGLTALKDVRYCFAGNTNPTTFVNEYGEDVNSPTLFESCKATLTSAEGLFAKCTAIAVDVPRELFQNCTALQTLRACFADCTSLSGTLPRDFLQGCTSLLYTNYMFYRCSNVGSDDAYGDVSVPSNIFDSCRSKISNVAYMFAGCGFTGRMETGDATTETNEVGFTTYTINRYGLLSECLALTSAEGMFRSCKKLKGAIPEDMFFTREAQDMYTRLTSIAYMFDNCEFMAMKASEYGIDGRNKQTVYGAELLDSDPGYLVPSNWLNRCPSLTTVAYLFNRVSLPYAPDAQFTAMNLNLADLTFNQQTKLQSVAYAFAHVKSLAANLTAIFLQNNLNTLTNAEGVFAFSNLKQAGAQQFNAVFEKNTSQTARNTVLTNLTYAFYNTNANNMTGYGPSPTKFTALNASNGMVYNQTKLTNYAAYSTNQKSSQNIYDTSHTYTPAAYNTAATLS